MSSLVRKWQVIDRKEYSCLVLFEVRFLIIFFTPNFLLVYCHNSFAVITAITLSIIANREGKYVCIHIFSSYMENRLHCNLYLFELALCRKTRACWRRCSKVLCNRYRWIHQVPCQLIQRTWQSRWMQHLHGSVFYIYTCGYLGSRWKDFNRRNNEAQLKRYPKRVKSHKRPRGKICDSHIPRRRKYHDDFLYR